EATATVQSTGTFDLTVPRFGGYRVVAASEAFANCDLTSVRVEPQRPHADLDLRLRACSFLAGRVVDAKGEGIGGAEVSTIAAKGEHSHLDGRPQSRDLYKNGKAQTAADGTFRITGMHPRTPYHVLCVPDPKRREVRALLENVEPGTGDLRFVL